MKLELVYTPNPILLKKTKKVVSFSSKIKAIVKAMKQVLLSCTDPEGVGLAAPQVGIPLQIFITRKDKSSQCSVYINPKIISIEPIKQKKGSSNMFEGCLSIKNIWGNVNRSQKLVVQYQTLSGEIQQKTVKGFDAYIIQHEIDHLHGILFTSRAVKQGRQLYKIEKKGKKEEFVPIDL